MRWDRSPAGRENHRGRQKAYRLRQDPPAESTVTDHPSHPPETLVPHPTPAAEPVADVEVCNVVRDPPSPESGEALMVGTAWSGELLLKARLPLYPSHPRATITILEGLALWAGRKLPVAVGANAASTSSIEVLLPDGQGVYRGYPPEVQAPSAWRR